MKKILSLLLAALTMILFTACNSSAEKTSASDKVPNDKILVAYFSCTGNTKKVALEVAELLNADIFEIVPAEPYTSDDLDYHADNCRANVEQKDPSARPAIKNKIDNTAQYKAIVIAYPIWWRVEPRIIDTFVESYDLTGKKIIPICTSGGSEIQASVANLRGLCKGAIVDDGKRLGNLSKEEVKAWLDSLGL